MCVVKYAGTILCIMSLFLLLSYKGMQLQKSPNNIVTLGFVGDVMIGRLVNEVIAQKGDQYIWGNVRQRLAILDGTIANLETTLTKSTNTVPKVFNFKADPDKVRALIEGNISLVSLANNHSCDFSDEGLLETIDVLDQAGILHVGAGSDEAQAARPVIIEKNGVRIGVIGFTDNEPGWQAGTNTPGTNYLTVGDIKKVTDDIKNVRNNVDILIATIHWGPNMRKKPSKEFVDFAHAMVDAGIDIIHGHSAHIVQGIEIYKNKLIMYDTGDFVDDYAVDSQLRNDLSFLFQVMLDKNGIRGVHLLPVKIEHMEVNHATGQDRHLIIDRMQARCAEFGTQTIEHDEYLEIVLTAL